jgi:hypothetical protein
MMTIGRWIGPMLLMLIVVGVFVALTAGWSLARRTDAPGLEGRADSTGDALLVWGPDPYALGQAAPTTGRVEMRVVDAGGRWSPLQSPDTVDVTAEFTHPADGSAYRVVMTTPMRQEPEGRYTTWFGVSFGHAHHGDTGIDTSALPRLASELAVWGYADIYRNGERIVGGAPTHAMVVKKEQGSLPGQVFLSVATEKMDLVGVPDGYLNLAWRNLDSLTTPTTEGIDEASTRQSDGALRPPKDITALSQYGRRELVGYGVLLAVVAGLLLLAIRPWPQRWNR